MKKLLFIGVFAGLAAPVAAVDGAGWGVNTAHACPDQDCDEEEEEVIVEPEDDWGDEDGGYEDGGEEWPDEDPGADSGNGDGADGGDGGNDGHGLEDGDYFENEHGCWIYHPGREPNQRVPCY